MHNLFDLRKGAERNAIIVKTIKDDIEFRGSRLWTLIFAVGVCSVGLNINSIPIVIGAMLISPLMGPIVGAGLALAINDTKLFRRSLRSLGIASLVSIVISAVYFAITPITNAQSELLARTKPTLFDVFIAIFGGVAGFIGASRAEKSNVIPGVAIATALMPPLVTVGYGIATFQATFLFGALYLFLINAAFICIAAFVIAKYMKLPKAQYENQEQRKKVRSRITAATLIIVIPSIFLAYTFVQENNFIQNANNYVETVFEDRGHVVIHKEFDYASSPQSIELAFLTARFSEEQINEHKARLADFNLSGAELTIRQDGFALTEEEWQEILTGLQNDAERVQALEQKLASERSAFSSAPRILKEVQVFEERIANIALGSLTLGEVVEDAEQGAIDMALVYYDTTYTRLGAQDEITISEWLKARLDNGRLEVLFLPEAE